MLCNFVHHIDCVRHPFPKKNNSLHSFMEKILAFLNLVACEKGYCSKTFFFVKINKYVQNIIMYMVQVPII